MEFFPIANSGRGFGTSAGAPWRLSKSDRQRDWLTAIVTIALAVGVAGVSAIRRGRDHVERLGARLPSNPDLNQERAGVRAQDETIPQATAAYRPTAGITGQYGVTHLAEAGTGSLLGGAPGGIALSTLTEPSSVGMTVSETVFNGNRNFNSVRKAESNVFSARENLPNTELNVLQNGPSPI